MKNFINCKREVNQRLSAFIIEIETAGKRLGIIQEIRMAFIKSKIKKEMDSDFRVLLNDQFVFTEELVSKIEDPED